MTADRRQRRSATGCMQPQRTRMARRAKYPDGAHVGGDPSEVLSPPFNPYRIYTWANKADMLKRAISIKQPFVEQILRGIKVSEFRSRSTKIRERVYLYASLKPRMERQFWTRVGARIGTLPTGRIVGSVEIAGCRRTAGGFAYLLRNPRRIRKHLYPTNQPQPGFWRPEF